MLLHQFIILDPRRITYAITFFNSQGTKLVESLGTLWQILSAILKQDEKEDVESIYLVIDALDECEEESRNYLLQSFDEHLKDYTYPKKVLKILAKSRPYVRIEDFLGKEPVIRLKTEDEEGNIREDIVSFINHKVEELKKKKSYNDSFANDVRDVLRKGS